MIALNDGAFEDQILLLVKGFLCSDFSLAFARGRETPRFYLGE
jgi:hypothetical protein